MDHRTIRVNKKNIERVCARYEILKKSTKIINIWNLNLILIKWIMFIRNIREKKKKNISIINFLFIERYTINTVLKFGSITII